MVNVILGILEELAMEGGASAKSVTDVMRDRLGAPVSEGSIDEDSEITEETTQQYDPDRSGGFI